MSLGEPQPTATVHTKHPVGRIPERSMPNMNARILWIIAAIIAVVGIIVLISGSVLWGIILLIVAALVGPGGYSIFQRRS